MDASSAQWAFRVKLPRSIAEEIWRTRRSRRRRRRLRLFPGLALRRVDPRRLRRLRGYDATTGLGRALDDGAAVALAGTTSGTAGSTCASSADADGAPMAGEVPELIGSGVTRNTARAANTATAMTTTNNAESTTHGARRRETDGAGVVANGEAVTAVARRASSELGTSRRDATAPSRASSPHSAASASDSSAAL